MTQNRDADMGPWSIDTPADERAGQPPFDVDVWWTPDCGYLHLERNPKTIPAHCPDNVAPYVEEAP